MVGIRIYVDEERVAPLFRRAITRQGEKVRAASRAAAQDVADEIKTRGDADIRAAGKFGSRWTDGYQVKVSEGGGNIRIAATEDVPYWRVFQYGAIIVGRPLLWIPLSFADDARGIRASDYPGRLFRVDRVGKAPLLLTPGKPAQPKYFGKESVTIPKKFHLIEIARDAARHLKDFYWNRFKQNG